LERAPFGRTKQVSTHPRDNKKRPPEGGLFRTDLRDQTMRRAEAGCAGENEVLVVTL
jgi:hypothetical protein